MKRSYKKTKNSYKNIHKCSTGIVTKKIRKRKDYIKKSYARPYNYNEH